MEKNDVFLDRTPSVCPLEQNNFHVFESKKRGGGEGNEMQTKRQRLSANKMGREVEVGNCTGVKFNNAKRVFKRVKEDLDCD